MSFTESDREVVDRLLTTTRTVRRRLDLDKPVSRDVIMECIDFALQAPTASNLQTWRFVVVTDPDIRARLGEVYRRTYAVADAPLQYVDANQDLFARRREPDDRGALVGRGT